MSAFCAAHRGLSADYAENTVAAFQAAVRAGFAALELDVRLTQDKEVVVLHDAGIERTTDGNGRVADMRYDELRQYETGEGPVPRLDDVLAVLRDWRGLWNIELKTRHATAATLELLEHHGILERAMVSSMSRRALAEARQTLPDLARALVVLGPPDQEDLDVARRTGCTWINADHDFLKEETVERLAAAGLRVGAWTVNDPQRARTLDARGVGCVYTDKLEVLETLAPTAPARPSFAAPAGEFR